MRNTITLILMFFSLAAIGQINFNAMDWGLGYSFTAPQGSMKDNIRQVHGFFIDMYLTQPEKRFSYGLEVSMNMYGHDKTRQTYTFSDGSTAPMDIAVSNNFYNVLAGGRYYLRSGNIQPFLAGKVGYSFYSTDLNIYDPDDTDHCEPVDNDVLKKDGAVIYSVGGGLRIDLLPNKKPGFLSLNVSANYTSGGNVDYMNVDAPSNSHAAHTSDVYVRFINTQTKVVHEHHVGNVYSSPIQAIDFRVGVFLKPSLFHSPAAN